MATHFGTAIHLPFFLLIYIQFVSHCTTNTTVSFVRFEWVDVHHNEIHFSFMRWKEKQNKRHFSIFVFLVEYYWCLSLLLYCTELVQRKLGKVLKKTDASIEKLVKI